MHTIRVLPPQVANRIAAGEVVERPSSVVKELVENAIDAGATAITVEIENGGIDYIRVSDNGSGIPSEQCATAFLRHATSKIAAADDISRIATLGFRGEALPSIASVSEVTLKTRTKDAESGTLLRIDNGEIVEQTAYACTEGTAVEVRNLFAKTPARLKFLKNPRTEAGYIGDYLSRMIMAMPEISFAYINNGKTVYRTFGDGSLKNAVFSIYGSSVLPQLRDVFYDDGYIRITGYVGTPAISRPNRMQQSLYLNGRYIRSFSVSNAVLRAYDTRLMVGKFPFFVLFLRVAGTEVDVNVHPTKMEVRFADERRITAAVYTACVRALEKPLTVRSFADESVQKSEDTRSDHKTAADEGLVAQRREEEICRTQISSSDSGAEPIKPVECIPNRTPASHADAVDKASAAEKEIRTALPVTELRQAMPKAVVTVQEAGQSASKFSAPLQQSGSMRPKPAPSVPIFEIVSHAKQREKEIREIQPEEPIRFGMEEYRLIGAVFSGYWIVEQGDTVFFIDQHAAHERRLYEELMSRRVEPSVQPLLIPEQMKLLPAEFALLEEYREEIECFGFSVRPLDEELTIEISAVPMIRGTTLSPNRLADALDILLRTGSIDDTDLCRNSLIQAACKHAIKVNEPISRAEIQHLLAEYAEGKIPMTCPHGRPIMVQITKLDIEKMFKRVL